MWIIREGVVGSKQQRGTGRYLWGAVTVPDSWAGQALGTARGGSYFSGGKQPMAAWWEQGQCGALRYTSRAEAWRVAARVDGRVIRLRTSDPKK